MNVLIEYALTTAVSSALGIAAYVTGTWFSAGRFDNDGDIRFGGDLVGLFTGLLAFWTGMSLLTSRASYVGSMQHLDEELEACRALAFEAVSRQENDLSAGIRDYLRLVATVEWMDLRAQKPRLSREAGALLDGLRKRFGHHDKHGPLLSRIESLRRLRLAEERSGFPWGRFLCAAVLLAGFCFFKGITPPTRYRVTLLAIGCATLGFFWALVLDAERPFTGMVQVSNNAILETIDAISIPDSASGGGARGSIEH